MSDSPALQAMAVQLEIEGYTPGSPTFDRVFRMRKVEMCRERQQVPVCSDCKFFDECELLKQHQRDKAEWEAALRQQRGT